MNKERRFSKIHTIVTIGLSSFVPALMIWISYDSIRNWTFNFNIFEVFRIIFYITMSIFAYYGMISFVKPLLSSFNHYTKNKLIIRILTIFITLSGLIILLKIMSGYETGLSHNDQGIVLEMIGFFIFLNPINQYVTNWFTQKNDEGIEHQLIIGTTAVGLVLIGLSLQFSYFN